MPERVFRDVVDALGEASSPHILVFPNISLISFCIVSRTVKMPKLLNTGLVVVARNSAVTLARRATSILAVTQYTCVLLDLRISESIFKRNLLCSVM